MIEIEKGVLMRLPKNNTIYPFRTMEIGDSVRYVGKHPTGAYNLAQSNSFRLSPKKFRGGRDESGVWRIWRVA